MARPIKNNADYFSHDNDMRDDERIKAVRRRFSHLGYSTWNMLLERLCRAENFRIEYNDDSVDIMAGDFNIEPEQLTDIIDYLIKLKLIIQDKEIIYSQTMINRFDGLFRKRKRDVERLSVTTTTNEPIIADDNTQSKVKDSKVNKRKENEIKEKGSKENQPPIFLNNFSFSGNKIMENDTSIVKTTISEEKEKSCAKKEINICKNLFENFAPQYVWESKDNEQLQLLINKIKITKSDIQNENQLADAFLSFIQKLPEYWRTKKFTIPNLCNNYNEIVSEIRANNLSGKTKKQTTNYKPIIQKPPEPKREPTPEEKIQMRKDFIKSICETFEKYVNTGEYGFLPLWIMYDTLVEEKVLKLNDKKLEAYRNKVIEQRKAELQKPKHTHEARTFSNILKNFEAEITAGSEKNRIETNTKTFAVKGLFEDLKKKQTDIKTLFNQ